MPSLDTLISYHRLKKAPLDDMEVFTDLRSLMDYCKDGASYDGQRVVVLNDTFGSVEYHIKNNIPIIIMKGSEPIFKSMTFKNDASRSHGMLIYEDNLGGVWEQNEVFSFNNGRLCLISQLEIFRILDASGNASFKFYMERRNRNTGTVQGYEWIQNYNPYNDGPSNPISSMSTMSEMSFYSTDFSWLKTNDTSIYLMPSDSYVMRNDIITKIYVKAEDYYNAWNGVD